MNIWFGKDHVTLKVKRFTDPKGIKYGVAVTDGRKKCFAVVVTEDTSIGEMFKIFERFKKR